MFVVLLPLGWYQLSSMVYSGLFLITIVSILIVMIIATTLVEHVCGYYYGYNDHGRYRYRHCLNWTRKLVPGLNCLNSENVNACRSAAPVLLCCVAEA